MKNKMYPQSNQHKSQGYPYMPIITTIAVPLLIKRRKKVDATQQPAKQKPPKPKPKPKGLAIAKYEISENVLKFFIAKGLFKKRWIAIKEISVNEISSVENLGNTLTVTWKDVTDSFVIKKKGESFSKLRDQIQGLLDEQRKTLESNAKTTLRRSDLAKVINASVGVVDLLFDMLMGLQVKTVNWTSLETYANGLGTSLNLAEQTMAPLSLDFTKVTDAVKSQLPQKDSKETFNVLKTIYEYFDDLKIEEDVQETHPNFKDTKAVILAYFTMNDILLGRIVGEKDNKEEDLVLETTLQDLANETNVKVNVEALKGCIDRVGVESDTQAVIDDAREIFREQLKQF